MFLALLALFAVPAIPEAAAQPEARRGVSVTVPDKHYFGLRAVASAQRQLVFNLKGLPPAEAITDVRLQLSALAKLFAQEGVDEEVIQMLKDVQKLTDEYLRYARTIDAIDEVALEKWNERMGLGERFGVALASAGAGAVVEPLSGSVIGFLVGFFLAEGYDEIARQRRAGQVSDERWNTIQAAKGELENRMEADYVRHQKCVKKLAVKYGWKAGEAGLDSTDAEAAGFYKPVMTPGNGIDTAVLEERLKALSAWTERRPRDPFTRLEHSVLVGQREGLKKKETSADMRTSAARLDDLARTAYAALDHIPKGERYAPYRAQFLLVAGDFASTAAALDVLARGKGYFGSESRVLARGKGYFGSESRYAGTAVKFWDECSRSSDELDSNGYIRMRLAFARVHDGQREKGLALADEVAKLRRAERCPHFACNYARLKTMTGEPDVAIEWLEHAVVSCGVNPSGFPDDPHLVPLKTSQPARFEALVTKRP